MRYAWRNKLATILAAGMMMASAYGQINPATQVNWRNLTGPGLPALICQPTYTGTGTASYGQLYLDTSTNPNVPYICGTNGWEAYNAGSVVGLTTTGTTGAASLGGGVINIPLYQGQIALTTSGTAGPATLSGNTLNIPQYVFGGGPFLPLAGGNLTGDIHGIRASFTGQVTAAPPTQPFHLVTKSYLDATLLGFCPSSTGCTFGAPIGGTDATFSGAVTGSSFTGNVTGNVTGNISGTTGTFTGPVIVRIPTLPNHAATKGYVDGAVLGFCPIATGCTFAAPIGGTSATFTGTATATALTAPSVTNGKTYTTGYFLCATDATGNPVDCGVAVGARLANGSCNGVATSSQATIYLTGLGGSSTSNCGATATSGSSFTIMAQNYTITSIYGYANTSGFDATSGHVTVYINGSSIAGSPSCTFGTTHVCDSGALTVTGSKGDRITASFSTDATESLGGVVLEVHGFYR